MVHLPAVVGTHARRRHERGGGAQPRDRVKIGIVSQSYYPRYGGVTEHVHHTASELRRRGHDVHVITSRFRTGETPDTNGVVRVGYNVLVPFNRAFVDLTIGVRLRHALRAIFKAHDFDLVHVHCPTAPTLPLFTLQTAPCPLVGTFHTTGGRNFLQDAFHPMLSGLVRRLDARIAVSETARDTALIYYPGKYEIIPNGVDVDQFTPGTPPFAEWRDANHVNLLFVGRLDPRKGVQVLLDVMPEVVRRTDGRARLLVVGDSYLRARFEASVAPEARGHVRFLGHVPSADLPRWYATGDVFVSPATGNESFGIVLAEAMAAGRAVVASDIPGYRSVVTPEIDGVVAPPGDVQALTEQIVRLARDPELRRELSRRGRVRALDFAWPRVTDRIEAVYREVLTRRSAVSTAA
jgi:phosphatidylinositol alpha-mannosyltransferase